jgi:hypothetical protein
MARSYRFWRDLQGCVPALRYNMYPSDIRSITAYQKDQNPVLLNLALRWYHMLSRFERAVRAARECYDACSELLLFTHATAIVILVTDINHNHNIKTNHHHQSNPLQCSPPSQPPSCASATHARATHERPLRLAQTSSPATSSSPEPRRPRSATTTTTTNKATTSNSRRKQPRRHRRDSDEEERE